MDINDYILAHSDDEGTLLAALNRDANVNLLRYRLCHVVYGGGNGRRFVDSYHRDKR